MKRIICIAMLIALASCASILPGEYFRQKGAADKSTEAVLVLKMWGNGTGGLISYKPKHMMQLVFQEVDSPRYTWITVSDKNYQTFRLPEGEWFLLTAMPNDILIGRGVPGFDYSYDKISALPFEPFTVKAGEALYLGNIELSGVKYETQIHGFSTNIGWKFTDQFEEANQRAAENIKKIAPDYPALRRGLLKKI